MIRSVSRAGAVPPWGLAMAAMVSVQLGSALSVHLISTVGPAGTAWLRLSLGALIFLAVARPPLREIRRRDLPALVGLGVNTGLQTIVFLAAIERLPLGTVVAVEFLGPLTVAAVRSHSRRALIWPALALIGVTLLTQPWQGDINLAGLGLAGLSAVGWATYIVLTQQIGDRFAGIQGLSVTVPISAATAAIFGIPQAAGHLTFGMLPAVLGLTLLLPVLPCALEMAALRRMTSTAFGTLMALEPAIGVLLGLLVLHQKPSALQVAGLLLVVLAGTAAQRGGRRHPPATELSTARAGHDLVGLSQLPEFARAPEILGAASRTAHQEQVSAGQVPDLEAARGGGDLAALDEVGDGQSAPRQCGCAAVAAGRRGVEQHLRQAEGGRLTADRCPSLISQGG
jgi:inner membrane transporter RhtA